MIIFGLLCIIVAAAVFGGVLYSHTESLPIEVFTLSIGDYPQWMFFLIGMAAGAVFLAGVELVIAGARRRTRRRIQHRRERREVREELQSVRDERDDLANRLMTPEENPPNQRA